MDTTRNAETPPNFAPKTSQKWPEKLLNVASETLEKTFFSLPLASLSCRFEAFNLATLQRATALLMGTTRNAETPPNFAPKTSQKWPEKLPNVASETLEKTIFGLPLASPSCRFEAFNLATLQRATALLMDTTRNAETPANFAPKTPQKWPEKLPNAASETLEKKQFLGCLWRSFPVALKPSTLQLCNAQQLYWWTPLETLKHHLISRPKHPKSDQKNSLTSLLKP